MSRGKSIIPDFMAKYPQDTFKLLFPLKLILDEDKFGNSHYEVVIKNMTTGDVFSKLISPELLFTHFPLYKPYMNGKKTKYYPTKEVFEKSFTIDSTMIDESNSKKLTDILDDDTIGTLIGWKRTFLNSAKYVNCYLVEQNDIKLIIPHYAIGVYYYFRFSEMREAALECNVESLYSICTDDRDDAKIYLSTPRTDEDAAFIHRFACQETAHKEFDNIGQYIHHYLKYMRENVPDREIDGIHLKINFPVKEKFQIDARITPVKNKLTNKEFYFVHEITNDDSDIGFDKFTKIIEHNSIIPDSDDLENLPQSEKDDPDDTSEILRVPDASKKYTRKQHIKDRKKDCGSLKGIIIDHESVTKDIIKSHFTIYQEQENSEQVDQSLTESASKGDKKIRKVVVSSEFKEEMEAKPVKDIDNFIIFKQYMSFLQKQPTIQNFCLHPTKDLPEFVKKGTKDINANCKIKKRARQYVTVTFKYENLFVGLLELENNHSSTSSTWVIISSTPITESIFTKFLKIYFVNCTQIKDIKTSYKKTDPKFAKKNHEREEILNDKQLASWYVGLQGYINLN
jgi:hypothetical protein